MTERELKDSQYLLQTVIDTIEGEVFVKDTNGKYLLVNKAFGKDFGVDPKAVIGKDDFFVFPPEAAAKLQENDKRIMAGRKAENIEESATLKAKNVTYLTNKVPLIDDKGNVFGICGVGFDITRQKKLEKALKDAHLDLERQVKERTAQLSETVDKLREAELRYRTVADFTYDWEYWTNLDGTLRYVSPSCERISGYTPRQFMDNPSLYREIIIPKDQDVWGKHYHDSRKEPGAKEIQFRIRRRDGSIRWIEHVCQPVIGDQEELLGFRASNRDITIRKEGEIKLQNAYSEIEALKVQLEADRTYLREEIKLEHDHENIIGNSDMLKYVLFRVEQVAPADTTVLILGETGTGKELIARAIHNASPRRERPLIKVDCASLPANLIESELFGHEKGSFTGAVEKRVGRFELANGATLFLDEIGELPLELQTKLLRVLQDGEFERLGSSQTLHADVRIIAATNRNLEEDVLKKHFRMDLWYRLSVFTISIPPLRERSEDIVLLVKYMIRHFERKLGKRISSIHTSVFTKLQDYSWPGNVRELENVIERAVINTQGDTLRLEDSLDAHRPEDVESPDFPIKSLEEIEREHILLALRKTNWKIHGENGAAALLDINPSTLRGRMRKQEIRRPSYKT
ncbi:MAG: sigma 54-interacting transcriptional regulator [Anaerolineaceae bacterium]|nr:sigma 54-interacting transcriptional regulator [Anaerolineaceae bacterium]